MKCKIPEAVYGTLILAGVIVKVAVGEPIKISHESARSHAPPQTPPSIMAITGIGKASIERRRVSSGSLYGKGSRPATGSSLMSCPEDQTFAPS